MYKTDRHVSDYRIVYFDKITELTANDFVLTIFEIISNLIKRKTVNVMLVCKLHLICPGHGPTNAAFTDIRHSAFASIP